MAKQVTAVEKLLGLFHFLPRFILVGDCRAMMKEARGHAPNDQLL
jgi:hypothetical protein